MVEGIVYKILYKHENSVYFILSIISKVRGIRHYLFSYLAVVVVRRREIYIFGVKYIENVGVFGMFGGKK